MKHVDRSHPINSRTIRHISVTPFCPIARLYYLEHFSFLLFFFLLCKTKKFLSLPRLHAWRETTIVTLVNVKIKLYLASADLIAEQWEWQTQRKGTERKGEKGRGIGGWAKEGFVFAAVIRVPYLLIHSTTRNRETLGSCRSRIRESRPTCVYVRVSVCACVCVYMPVSFFRASLFLPIPRV